MGNAHQMIHTPYYGRCGFYNFPGMLTLGQGGQTLGMYRVQMFLWAIFGSPLVIGADIRNLSADYMQLITAPEVLQINADPDCTQGSLVASLDAGELWIRPLSGARFAAVMLNKSPSHPVNVTVWFTHAHLRSSFYPADVGKEVRVRDAWLQRDVGSFDTSFTRTIAPQDASIFLLTPM